MYRSMGRMSVDLFLSLNWAVAQACSVYEGITSLVDLCESPKSVLDLGELRVDCSSATWRDKLPLVASSSVE